MRKIFGMCAVVVFSLSLIPSLSHAAAAALITSPFSYLFSVAGLVEETGSMDSSSSPYWWVNSGAGMSLTSGIGGTLKGDLATSSRWRILYASANPQDTDNGYHPQNIFRLLTRSKWQNSRETVYFRITKDQLSASPNRNASNGLLLFNRYQSSATTYYAGLRVDGAAVIKKKINGTYYTVGYKKVFSGTYNAATSPNLLPKDKWIGIRTETINNTDGTLTLKLFTDIGKTGTWTLALQVTDNGTSYGGAPITNAGYSGIRTDFMDVQFDDFKIENI